MRSVKPRIQLRLGSWYASGPCADSSEVLYIFQIDRPQITRGSLQLEVLTAVVLMRMLECIIHKP